MSKKKPPVTYAPDEQELAFVTLLNAYRASRKLRKLTLNGRLGMAAERHALDMVTHDFVSHTGSDGSEGSQRMQRAGYDWARWGECIYAGPKGDADGAIAELKKSPTHDAMMRNRKMAHVGVGRVARAGDALHAWYWTVNFGSKEL